MATYEGPRVRVLVADLQGVLELVRGLVDLAPVPRHAPQPGQRVSSSINIITSCSIGIICSIIISRIRINSCIISSRNINRIISNTIISAGGWPYC